MTADATTDIAWDDFGDTRPMMGQEGQESDSYMLGIAGNMYTGPRVDTGGHNARYAAFEENRMLWEMQRQRSFVAG